MLRGSRLRQTAEKQDINPMDGLANLSDVMLVFACGLLLALIAAYNVDWQRGTTLVSIEQGEQAEEIEGLMESSLEDGLDRYGLEEFGRVFRDPATGALYMVTENYLEE